MNASLAKDVIAQRVSRETVDRLERFSAVFEKWAGSINLVAPSTLGDVWQRHILDSLQIHDLVSTPKHWIDLGSGGGFPGVITAICLADADAGWVELVESNKKKAAFLRAAITETGARATVHAIRIEEAPNHLPHCDAISARALADLSHLLEFSFPWMEKTPECRAFFHKGRDYQAEIDKAVGCWQFDLVRHESVVEQDSVVLEITRLSRK